MLSTLFYQLLKVSSNLHYLTIWTSCETTRILRMLLLVLRDLLPDLRKVEHSLPGAARVESSLEQVLVVVRPDEPWVAILLEKQEIDVLCCFVIGVPGECFTN